MASPLFHRILILPSSPAKDSIFLFFVASLYMSIVVVISACPIISWIIFRLVSFSQKRVQNVCRKWWQLKCGNSSGSRRSAFASSDEEQFADILSKTLAIRLLEDGKRISTGVGRKLGTYITGYAHQYLAEKSIRNTHRYLSMRPFPFHLDLTDEDKVVYRKLM